MDWNSTQFYVPTECSCFFFLYFFLKVAHLEPTLMKVFSIPEKCKQGTQIARRQNGLSVKEFPLWGSILRKKYHINICKRRWCGYRNLLFVSMFSRTAEYKGICFNLSDHAWKEGKTIFHQPEGVLNLAAVSTVERATQNNGHGQIRTQLPRATQIKRLGNIFGNPRWRGDVYFFARINVTSNTNLVCFSVGKPKSPLAFSGRIAAQLPLLPAISARAAFV